MRTSGRKLRSGERSRANCSYCGAVYDRRDLIREPGGLLRCPSEGNGRDTATLTRDSVAAAEAWAQRKVPEPHDPGPLDNQPATRQPAITANWLKEDGTPILTEDSYYFAVE